MANACTNLTGAVQSVRLFKIDAFSLAAKNIFTVESIKSRWNVDGHEWEIRCCPAYGGQWPQWVTLDLMLRGEALTSNVAASLSCLLVYPRLPPVHNEFHQEKTQSHVFSRPGDCSPRVLLVSHSYIPKPGCPKDDYLTVQCTITVLKELPADPPSTVVVPVPSSNLHLHFGELLQSKTGADVTFVIAGECFAVHKSILAARSPVFMAEFFGEMKEKCSQRVEVKDVEAAAFRAMLHFIYTDTVPELDQEEAAATVIAQHLLAAADRYGLDRLKLICEGTLSSGITVCTAATTLALAEQHNRSHLKAKCVEFIVSTPAILDAVTTTEGYKHLEASCPSVLTELLKSMCARKN